MNSWPAAKQWYCDNCKAIVEGTVKTVRCPWCLTMVYDLSRVKILGPSVPALAPDLPPELGIVAPNGNGRH